MTFDEYIAKRKNEHPEERSFLFDYYRSILNNDASDRIHYVITSTTSHAPLYKGFGGDNNYQSPDMFDDNDAINILMIPAISDYKTFFDEAGNFDRDRAVRYVD